MYSEINVDEGIAICNTKANVANVVTDLPCKRHSLRTFASPVVITERKLTVAIESGDSG